MNTFYINKESFPSRCEVCHTNNTFNPIYKRCFQCATISEFDYKLDNTPIFNRKDKFYIAVINCLILFNVSLVLSPLIRHLNIFGKIFNYLTTHRYEISCIATYGYYLVFSIIVGIFTIVIIRMRFGRSNSAWLKINQKISFHMALLNIVASIVQLILCLALYTVLPVRSGL